MLGKQQEGGYEPACKLVPIFTFAVSEHNIADFAWTCFCWEQGWGWSAG